MPADLHNNFQRHLKVSARHVFVSPLLPCFVLDKNLILELKLATKTISDQIANNLQACSKDALTGSSFFFSFFFFTTGVESTELTCDCRASDGTQKRVKSYEDHAL